MVSNFAHENEFESIDWPPNLSGVPIYKNASFIAGHKDSNLENRLETCISVPELASRKNYSVSIQIHPAETHFSLPF